MQNVSKFSGATFIGDDLFCNAVAAACSWPLVVRSVVYDALTLVCKGMYVRERKNESKKGQYLPV